MSSHEIFTGGSPQFDAMSSCGDCSLCCVNIDGLKIYDVNAAVFKGCIDCFKKCYKTPTQWARCGWTEKTVVHCVKKNRLDMFLYAYERKRGGEGSDKEYATSYAWNPPWPTVYLIAINAIPHKNEGWYPYILQAMNAPLNRSMTNSRRRTLVERVFEVGDFELLSKPEFQRFHEFQEMLHRTDQDDEDTKFFKDLKFLVNESD